MAGSGVAPQRVSLKTTRVRQQLHYGRPGQAFGAPIAHFFGCPASFRPAQPDESPTSDARFRRHTD